MLAVGRVDPGPDDRPGCEPGGGLSEPAQLGGIPEIAQRDGDAATQSGIALHLGIGCTGCAE